MRGGKRKGAGAPRKEVHKKSVVLRVPIALHGAVMDMISTYNIGGETNNRTTKEDANPIEPTEEHIDIYECGCINDNGVFRRYSKCKLERSKHA